MAASYLPLGSHRDIQQLSDTSVVDIQRVAALTQPSGIYFERVVPLTIFGTAAADAYIAELAEAIEQRIAGGLADTASWSQDTDANGLLVDVIEFVISIPGPDVGGQTFSTTVPVPVNLLTAGLGGQGGGADTLLDNALQQLRATAAA